MVTTVDARVAERLRALRVHGRRQGVHESIGTNSRLDEIHAAVLRVKLPLLDGWNDTRRRTAARYRAALGRASSGLVAPVEIAGAHHVYHHFTVRTPRRSELRARLLAEGIATAVHYPRGLHEQPAFASWARGPLIKTERAAAEVLSIPVHPWLTSAEIEKIAATLESIR